MFSILARNGYEHILDCAATVGQDMQGVPDGKGRHEAPVRGLPGRNARLVRLHTGIMDFTRGVS